jgi:23S rRNA (cytosine1962-C5)-methyltransferase
MTRDNHLVTIAWDDYELLDSGSGHKLERFGAAILIRPETQALWQKTKPERWKEAHAEFSFGEKKGTWKIRRPLPDPWILTWRDVRVTARLTSFKHTGIFPEQAANWAWTEDKTRSLHEPQVLNLFGYTGVASLVAALSGAHVTHVDASSQTLDWAHDNAKLSNVDSIRWIHDDALAFTKRESRRGARYDGIILDPPAFGRGPKGEVWHIEKDLPNILSLVKPLLREVSGSFFLLNGYAAGYSPLSIAQMIEGIWGDIRGESGELRLGEDATYRMIPSGIYARFVKY